MVMTFFAFRLKYKWGIEDIQSSIQEINISYLMRPSDVMELISSSKWDIFLGFFNNFIISGIVIIIIIIL